MVRIEDGDINSVATKHGVSESRSCASKFFITYNSPIAAINFRIT
jgi:hypothetical protein